MTASTTPMIRGYAIIQTARYLQTQFSPEQSRRGMAALPAAIRDAIPTWKPGEWYPRETTIALYRAIAGLGGDEPKVYEDLVRCGEFIASEAAGTFLRLVMRIMTPVLFASKIPDFFRRDHSAGSFEVDTSRAKEALISMRLVDVAGFDHIGVVSIGWIKFGMKSLGKTGVTIKQRGWTLAAPGPGEVSYEIRWA